MPSWTSLGSLAYFDPPLLMSSADEELSPYLVVDDRQTVEEQPE